MRLLYNNKKMNFSTDKKSLTEGDVIELTWNCPGAERVELTIDNGYKRSMVSLEASGAKKFRLNRSRGKTRLVVTSWKAGRKTSRTVRVRVRPIPTLRAEEVDDRGRTPGLLKQWWRRMHAKGQNSRSRTRQAWQAMPERKRLASTVMLVLAGIAVISSFIPRIMPIGLLVLMLYLGWVVLKK